jgi:hypothetical protein
LTTASTTEWTGMGQKRRLGERDDNWRGKRPIYADVSDKIRSSPGPRRYCNSGTESPESYSRCKYTCITFHGYTSASSAIKTARQVSTRFDLVQSGINITPRISSKAAVRFSFALLPPPRLWFGHSDHLLLSSQSPLPSEHREMTRSNLISLLSRQVTT